LIIVVFEEKYHGIILYLKVSGQHLLIVFDTIIDRHNVHGNFIFLDSLSELDPLILHLFAMGALWVVYHKDVLVGLVSSHGHLCLFTIIFVLLRELLPPIYDILNLLVALQLKHGRIFEEATLVLFFNLSSSHLLLQQFSSVFFRNTVGEFATVFLLLVRELSRHVNILIGRPLLLLALIVRVELLLKVNLESLLFSVCMGLFLVLGILHVVALGEIARRHVVFDLLRWL